MCILVLFVFDYKINKTNMIRTRKLSLEELTEYFDSLSEENQRKCQGGYGPDGNCYYNCLEFLSRKYDGPMNYHNYLYYANDYTYGEKNKNDDWNGLDDENRCFDTVNEGPKFYDSETGNIDTTTLRYLSSQFETSGSEWVTGSGIQDLFAGGTGSYKKGYVMGTMITGSGTAHAAIFSGYDAATDTYSYYNPNDKGYILKIEASKVLSAIKITGKK